MSYKYLYGPIPSRRFGISLGVDLIPWKTCPLNCIYCECGATNNFTNERKEYVPTKVVMDEIVHFIENNHPPDFITFSGSGEPTLHSGLGELITFVKTNYPQIKVAVITNSVMLTLDGVQEELMLADLVAPSLDGATEQVFRAIDLPMNGIHIEDVTTALRNFAKNYLTQSGKQLWLEIFVIEGLNTTESEINSFIEILKTIPYTKLHLNRLDRIGTKIDLKPASMAVLHEMQDTFIHAGLKDVEIIGKCKNKDEIRNYQHSIEETITSTLDRRSMSLEDLMEIAQTTEDEIGRYLDMLSAEKRIISQIIDGKIVYKILHTNKKPS
ncbi:MAG: radical SAM protein [Brevinema sp.]